MLNTAAKTQAPQHLQQDTHKGVVGAQYIKFYTSVNKWGDPNASPSRQDARRQICDYSWQNLFLLKNAWPQTSMHTLHGSSSSLTTSFSLDTLQRAQGHLSSMKSGFSWELTDRAWVPKLEDLDEEFLGKSRANSKHEMILSECYPEILNFFSSYRWEINPRLV